MSKEDSALDRISSYLECKNDTELAKQLGIARTTLSSWRRRGSVPTDTLCEFAQEHGVSLDYLLIGRGVPKVESAPSKAIADSLLSYICQGLDQELMIREWFSERKYDLYYPCRVYGEVVKSIGGAPIDSEIAYRAADEAIADTIAFYKRSISSINVDGPYSFDDIRCERNRLFLEIDGMTISGGPADTMLQIANDIENGKHRPARFLAAWKDAVKLAGMQFFDIRSATSIDDITNKKDATPNLAAISNRWGFLNRSQGHFLLAISQFYNNQKVYDFCREQEIKVPSLSDLTLFNDRYRAILVPLLQYYDGW